MDELQQFAHRLASNDLSVRREAARRLAQDTTPQPELAVNLVRALEGPFDERLMQWVESALEDIGAPPPESANELAQIVGRFLSGSDKPDAAFWAATLLGRIGRPAAVGVPALTSLLGRDDHPHLQWKAAWALGKIGKPAQSSLPHLTLAAANLHHPRLAASAQQAIQEINR